MTRDKVIKEFRGVVVNPIMKALEKLIEEEVYERMPVDPLIAPESQKEGRVFLELARSFIAHLRAWKP